MNVVNVAESTDVAEMKRHLPSDDGADGHEDIVYSGGTTGNIYLNRWFLTVCRVRGEASLPLCGAVVTSPDVKSDLHCSKNESLHDFN